MLPSDVLAMHLAIERLTQDPTPRPAGFAYALARNKRLLAPLVEAHREALHGDWIAPLQAFETERQALVMKHARTRDDGQPVILPGGRVVVADVELFERELGELEEKHPESKGAQVRFDERQAALLGIENDVALVMIAPSDLPAEIDLATMEALLPMIAE